MLVWSGAPKTCLEKIDKTLNKSHLLIFHINKNNDNNKMQIKLFIDKEELEQIL